MNQIAKIHDDAPHQAEVEQTVLGIMILHKGRGLAEAARAGGAELFHDPVHSIIYAAIEAKSRADDLISPVTIAAALSSEAGLETLGGGRYIVRLAGLPGRAEDVGAYINLLEEFRSKRRLTKVLVEAQNAIARGDEPANHIASRIEASLIEMPPVSGRVALYRCISPLRRRWLNHRQRSTAKTAAQSDRGLVRWIASFLGSIPAN